MGKGYSRFNSVTHKLITHKAGDNFLKKKNEGSTYTWHRCLGFQKIWMFLLPLPPLTPPPIRRLEICLMGEKQMSEKRRTAYVTCKPVYENKKRETLALVFILFWRCRPFCFFTCLKQSLCIIMLNLIVANYSTYQRFT